MNRRATSIGRALVLAAALVGGSAVPMRPAVAASQAAAPEVATATTREPRAYGHAVGDVVSRRVFIDVPSGLALDPASVPQTGRRGKALELRRVAMTRGWDGRHVELELEYQVFLAPREVRVLEMPAFTLRFIGAPREQSVRVDAWPLSVAPLVAVDAPSRRGLGELQPDAAPPHVDTRLHRAGLAGLAVVLALLLADLAWVYFGVPWRAGRRRPFGLAWRALRSLPGSTPPADANRAALARLHDALNLTAGEVLFEPDVERFVAEHPQFVPLRGDLAAFFERSQATFFSTRPATDATGEVAWLQAFCQRCRDAERGSA